MQSNDSSKKGLRLTASDLATLGITTAIIEVSKKVLEPVPNVELVTFLFILFTLFYGRKMVISAVTFTLIEVAWFGPQTWVIMYLYIWPLLVLIVWAFRKHANLWFCSILAAIFGLLFGLMCSVVYLFIGGPYMMFTWWVAGIPWDILHGISNFVICFVLYKPAKAAMMRITQGSYID